MGYSLEHTLYSFAKINYMKNRKINLSTCLCSLFLFISAGSYGQSLKTYSGSFANGSNQPGQANYKYYEDPKTREYVKQGAFNYSLNGKDENKGLRQTISGNYEKGLKHGTWTYKLVMNDYFLGYYHATGTITLTANYKNGLADGNWKYYSKNKTRLYSRYTGWGAYNPENNITTSMNFSKGRIVGNVIINEVGVLKVNGNYDLNSYSNGTWKLDFLNKNQTFEITFKDKYMTDFIGRNGSGQILDGSTSLNPELNAERNQRFLDLKGASLEELENAGYDLDTLCYSSVPTKYIQDYFKYMMKSDWFLYKHITGDLTYQRYSKSESIPGGCNIVVEKAKFSKMDNIRGYEKAEKSFSSGLYFDAFNSYNDVKRYIKQYTGYRYKKSDLKRLDKKTQLSFDKADSLSKILISKREVNSLSSNLSKRIKEEENIITSSLESKDMAFYRYFQEGAINSLNDLDVNDVLKESYQSKAYFNPNRLTNPSSSKSDGEVYYLYCNKASVIDGLKDMLDDRLEEIRKFRLISEQFESKSRQIEELNLTKKTKLLYVTYSEVMNNLKNGQFKKGLSIVQYVNFITIINLSLDKIIAHYDDKPKTMDKALKKAYNKKLKNELLFPFFPFDSNGRLKGYDIDGFRNGEG